MAAAFFMVAFFAALTIWTEFRNGREQARAQVLSIAELRAGQVEAWIGRQMMLAEYIRDGKRLGDLFRAWQVGGDKLAGEMLLQRAVALRRANRGDSALLVDSAGAVLADEHPASGDTGPDLEAAVLEAMKTGSATRTDIYRREGADMAVRLDVVIPLLHSGTPPLGAIVLRMDPRGGLFPLLGAWPVPTESGESMLWHQVGDRVVNLNDGRGRPDSAGRFAQPLASSPLPVARLLRGEVHAGEVVKAIDYRGVSVMATVRAVPDSDWWLVSKIDLDEVDAPARKAATWTIALTCLVVAGAGLAGRLWLQRRRLAIVLDERDAHAARLRALNLLDAIAKSSNDTIFAKDLDGRYVFYNDAGRNMLGRDPAEVLGHTDHELFPPEAADRLVANDRAAMASESPRVFEEVIPRADGDRIGMCAKGLLVDATGRRIGMFGVSRDVTDERHAARARQDHDAHLRAVFAVLDEGILVCAPDGTVLICNPAAERFIGRTTTAADGRPVVAPEWSPRRPDGTPMPADEMPAARILAGLPGQDAVLLQTEDPAGAVLWFEVRAVPVHRPDTGELIAVVSSFSDMTRRRQQDTELQRHRDHLESLVAERTRQLEAANASLVEQQNLARAVADAMPGMIAYWDADLRCRFASQAHYQWYGKQPEDMVGMRLQDLQNGEIFARNERNILAALRGERQEFQRTLTRRDGAVRYTLVDYLPDVVDGKVQGFYVVVADVTDLKEAELELARLNEELSRRVDQAEAATRAKSAFLANMSHEIRTPMNAIIGLTQLLARDATDARQRERLGRVDVAAKHLLQVINDILDLSKIEAGRLVLEETTFTRAELLARALDIVQEDARAKGLTLMVDAGRLPERMRGDPNRLAQALINLLSNAVKFTEKGSVRLKAEPVSDDDGRLLIRFEVQDTGPGIPLERQPALFAAFEQADSSTTRRHGGTGLGLALTRHLAQSMGGEVGMDSKPGNGSTFWFTARVARAPEVPDRLPAPAPDASMQRLRQRFSGRRVLLAEDNLINQEVASELVRAAGLVVDTADDGARALDLVRSRHYDIVLMDVQMPVMDGLAAARAMREVVGKDLPIVAITANAFVEDRTACLAAGMNDHVPKPVDPAVLYATVLRWLENGGRGAPASNDARTSDPGAGLKQGLEGIAGISPAQALRMVDGNWNTLARVLGSFVRCYAEGEPVLVEQPSADVIARWGRASHSLRGACAMIGATALERELTAFESRLRSAPPEELAVQAGAIHDTLRQLAADLARVLHEPPALRARAS